MYVSCGGIRAMMASDAALEPKYPTTPHAPASIDGVDYAAGNIAISV